MSGKLDFFSPKGDKVRKSDGTVVSSSDVAREGNAGCHSDGVITERSTISVGKSKGLYIKALKDCSINIFGYIHSTLAESNKFSAVEIFFLGIEDTEIEPTFGPDVFDLMIPRSILNTMDGTLPHNLKDHTVKILCNLNLIL